MLQISALEKAEMAKRAKAERIAVLLRHYTEHVEQRREAQAERSLWELYASCLARDLEAAQAAGDASRATRLKGLLEQVETLLKE